MPFCEDCFEKQRKIDELTEKVERITAKLKRYETENKEGYFGSSTPSSQQPFKEKSKEHNNGGAKKGHRGNGRKSIQESQADRTEHLTLEKGCPHCGNPLKKKGTVDRSVIESSAPKTEKVLYKCTKYWCPVCEKTFQKKPTVLPRSLYGNGLIAQAATMHYVEGIPLGRIESILGDAIISGSLFDVFHRVANLWQPALLTIINAYRNAQVKHADETGWRTDGRSGYAWLFCSENESIFKFANTRSATVPIQILGTDPLPGVLVVDRYGAYNKRPSEIQYCYAHLLRKIEDLEKEFPDNQEIACFVTTAASLLAEAMHMRNLDIPDDEYYKKALQTKQKIMETMNSAAAHPGIKEIQTIFKKHEKRMYHWATNRNVPPDNNRAERELRPSVIARKVSFGSQSEKGAQTRSILMTILHTAKKRVTAQSVQDWFKEALDTLSLNPTIDPSSLLPPPT